MSPLSPFDVPTPRQREILELLASGKWLDTSYRHPKFLYGPYINLGTWNSLRRRGWVRPNGITEEGRLALTRT